MGSGLAQFIITLLNAAIRKPTYILIDEPEVNLHPSLQLDLLTTLASYASEGVMFATHSLGLARASADAIYSVRPNPQGSQVALFEATTSLAEFLGKLSYSGYSDLGFRKVLLVEGVTEVRTVQQFLRWYKMEHEIVLLPLGGRSLIKAGVEIELQEIKKITPSVYALVDSEKSSATDALEEGRRDFLTVCARLDIDHHVLDRRALENYFPQKALDRLNRGWTALGHFDKAPRGWPKDWNWRIAQDMSRDDISGTDLEGFLNRLCSVDHGAAPRR